ncbi:MAG TPA: hypothetical protein DDZ80_17995 [Cyanobacteria bacterium UBA8803]|nr:hypothetical protein [Cyanobacteria bacterium UBA9273]HBL60278.1 hypothetical protein [Cyanobacteria bacterium UBA8803]
MRLYLVSLSFTTLLLSVTSLLLLPTFNLSPLVAQAQMNQDRKDQADRLLAEGIEQYDNLNFGGALGKFEQAVLIYQEIGNKVGVGAAFHQIGLVYNSREEYQQALDYYHRALAIQREVSDGPSARVTLYRIGKIYDRLEEYQKALAYYQQALAIRQEVSNGKNQNVACRDRAWQGITLTGTGRVYQRLKEYQQALDYYQQALTIRQELSNCAKEDIPRSYDRGATLLHNMGLVAQELGKYQQALNYYQQALVIYEEVDEPDEQWAILNRIGIVYRQLGEYQQALDYFQQAQKMNLLIGHFGQGGAFNNIGLVYDHLGEYQQALNFYQKALKFAQKIGDRAGEGVTLNNIGAVYHKLEKYQQALDSYQKALAIVQEVGDRKAEGVILNNMGAAYHKRGESQQALDRYQQALVIVQEIGEKAFAAITLNNIGLTYDHLGESQQALDYYQQALAIQQEIGDDSSQGKPAFPVTLNLEPLLIPAQPILERADEELRLYQQGMQLSKQGQYREALLSFQQALVITRELGDRTREWHNLNQIGLVYQSVGEYTLALDFFSQALAIPKQAFEDTGAIHYNMGIVYQQLGQYQLALDFYQKASEIARKGNDKAGRVRILNTIGNVYSKLQQYDLARDSFSQALAIIPTLNFEKKILEGATLHNMANIYREQEKYDLALDLFEQALTIYKQFGSKEAQAGIIHNIGKVYFEQGQYDLAWDLYQQALVIAQEIGNKAGEGQTLKNIGYLLEKQNQPELAIVFFKQSVNAREAIRNNIKKLPQEFQQSYTETIAEDYRHLADLLLKQNRILEAQRVLDLLKVQELDTYLRNVRGTRGTAQGIPNLPPEQQLEDSYQVILDRAITLGKELTQLRQQGNRTPEEEQRITQLVKAQEKITEDFNTFIASDEVEALIAQLTPKTRKPDLVDDLEDLIGLQDNLSNLQQNAVLLYPLILDDRIELILTTPDSPPIRRTVPVTKVQLNQAIVEFRQALQNPTSDAKIPAQQLYNWLIKPLAADLKAAEAQTIIYAPDSQLRYIPLSALYDGQQWLVQRYRVNNITATSLTDLNSKPQPQLQVLAGAFATGNYSFDISGQRFNFSGLPFAKLEVETLAKTVPNTTGLLDNAFTPEATIPQMDNYSVVHFATHGAFVVGTPEESFILFGNGARVTLKDIEKWNLKNVDLVVLSACETGIGGKLGNGEEILGLGYQMQRAGARAVIASLWTVDDGGTQALMNGFYAALQAGKITKAEALRQAQISLITGNYTALGEQRGLNVVERFPDNLSSRVANQLSHPYYWAPFILIGNGL